jgi:hypothetical protein
MIAITTSSSISVKPDDLFEDERTLIPNTPETGGHDAAQQCAQRDPSKKQDRDDMSRPGSRRQRRRLARTAIAFHLR